MICAQARGGLKAAMIQALRPGKPGRGPRRRSGAGKGSGSAIVPEALKILHRPWDVEARPVPVHWEGDLITGAFNRSSVGTLVERKAVLSRTDGNGAEAALEPVRQKWNPVLSKDRRPRKT